MADKFKNTCCALWAFLIHPVKEVPLTATWTEKLKIFLPLFLLELMLAMFLGMIISGLSHLDIISFKDHKVQLLIRNMPLWQSFTIIVIISPFIEELIFRQPLRLSEKYLHLNVLLILGVISLLMGSNFKVTTIKMSILAIGAILWLIYLSNKAKYNFLILEFLNRKFLLLFYFSAVTFGAVHIFNYKPGLTVLLFFPLLIMPQLFMGLVSGYIRLKLGFLWSCFLHSLHNFIFFIPILLVAPVILPETGTTKITEHNNIRGSMRITNDTIDFNGVRLGNIVQKLLNVRKENIEFKDTSVANIILTLHYERAAKMDSGKLKSSRSLLLHDLLSKYNLKLEQYTPNKYIYQIQIVDSIKLNRNARDKNDLDTTWTAQVFYDNEIILHNANLSLFARTINLNYPHDVVSSLSVQNRYTLKIPKLEFEELNHYLMRQYGLKLSKSNEKVIVYTISKIRKPDN